MVEVKIAILGCQEREGKNHNGRRTAPFHTRTGQLSLRPPGLAVRETVPSYVYVYGGLGEWKGDSRA